MPWTFKLVSTTFHMKVVLTDLLPFVNAESHVPEKPPLISQGSLRRTTAVAEVSNLANSLPAKRGFKMASLNVNSLIKHIDDLRIFLPQIQSMSLQLMNPNSMIVSIIASCTSLATKLIVRAETGMVAVYVFILKPLLTLQL